MAKRFAQVDKDRCVACGECVNACPKGAASIYNGCFAVVDLNVCLGCGLCEKNCPAGSINILERK